MSQTRGRSKTKPSEGSVRSERAISEESIPRFIEVMNDPAQAPVGGPPPGFYEHRTIQLAQRYNVGGNNDVGRGIRTYSDWEPDAQPGRSASPRGRPRVNMSGSTRSVLKKTSEIISDRSLRRLPREPSFKNRTGVGMSTRQASTRGEFSNNNSNHAAGGDSLTRPFNNTSSHSNPIRRQHSGGSTQPQRSLSTNGRQSSISTIPSTRLDSNGRGEEPRNLQTYNSSQQQLMRQSYPESDTTLAHNVQNMSGRLALQPEKGHDMQGTGEAFPSQTRSTGSLTYQTTSSSTSNGTPTQQAEPQQQQLPTMYRSSSQQQPPQPPPPAYNDAYVGTAPQPLQTYTSLPNPLAAYRAQAQRGDPPGRNNPPQHRQMASYSSLPASALRHVGAMNDSYNASFAVDQGPAHASFSNATQSHVRPMNNNSDVFRRSAQQTPPRQPKLSTQQSFRLRVVDGNARVVNVTKTPDTVATRAEPIKVLSIKDSHNLPPLPNRPAVEAERQVPVNDVRNTVQTSRRSVKARPPPIATLASHANMSSQSSDKQTYEIAHQPQNLQHSQLNLHPQLVDYPVSQASNLISRVNPDGIHYRAAVLPNRGPPDDTVSETSSRIAAAHDDRTPLRSGAYTPLTGAASVQPDYYAAPHQQIVYKTANVDTSAQLVALPMHIQQPQASLPPGRLVQEASHHPSMLSLLSQSSVGLTSEAKMMPDQQYLQMHRNERIASPAEYSSVHEEHMQTTAHQPQTQTTLQPPTANNFSTLDRNASVVASSRVNTATAAQHGVHAAPQSEVHLQVPDNVQQSERSVMQVNLQPRLFDTAVPKPVDRTIPSQPQLDIPPAQPMNQVAALKANVIDKTSDHVDGSNKMKVPPPTAAETTVTSSANDVVQSQLDVKKPSISGPSTVLQDARVSVDTVPKSGTAEKPSAAIEAVSSDKDAVAVPTQPAVPKPKLTPWQMLKKSNLLQEASSEAPITQETSAVQPPPKPASDESASKAVDGDEKGPLHATAKTEQAALPVPTTTVDSQPKKVAKHGWKLLQNLGEEVETGEAKDAAGDSPPQPTEPGNEDGDEPAVKRKSGNALLDALTNMRHDEGNAEASGEPDSETAEPDKSSPETVENQSKVGDKGTGESIPEQRPDSSGPGERRQSKFFDVVVDVTMAEDERRAIEDEKAEEKVTEEKRETFQDEPVVMPKSILKGKPTLKLFDVVAKAAIKADEEALEMEDMEDPKKPAVRNSVLKRNEREVTNKDDSFVSGNMSITMASMASMDNLDMTNSTRKKLGYVTGIETDSLSRLDSDEGMEGSYDHKKLQRKLERSLSHQKKLNRLNSTHMFASLEQAKHPVLRVRRDRKLDMLSGRITTREAFAQRIVDYPNPMSPADRRFRVIMGLTKEEPVVPQKPQYRLYSGYGRQESDFGVGKKHHHGNGHASMLTMYLHWSFRTSFTWVLITDAAVFFGLVYLFSILIHEYGLRYPQCILPGGEHYDTGGNHFIDALSLSWTTFSTVGYGSVYPKINNRNGRDLKGCITVTVMISLEAFIGVIFASFCGAVIFSKVARAQSMANILFSDPMVIKFGKALLDGSDDHLDDSESQHRYSDGKTYPCPILEFRIINRLHSDPGGEIINASIRCVASTLAAEAFESNAPEVEKKVKKGFLGALVKNDLTMLAAKKWTDAASGAKRRASNFGTISSIAQKSNGVTTPRNSLASAVHKVMLTKHSSIESESGSSSSAAFTPTGSTVPPTPSGTVKSSLALKLQRAAGKAAEAKRADSFTREKEPYKAETPDPHRPNDFHASRRYGVEEDPLVPRRVFSKLDMETDTHPFFNRVWYIRHVLDANSPLLKWNVKKIINRNQGRWPEKICNYKFIRDNLHFHQIIVTVNGTANDSGSSVYGMKVYEFSSVNVGYTFAHVSYVDEEGGTSVDTDLINDVMEQEGGGAEPFDVTATDSDLSTNPE